MANLQVTCINKPDRDSRHESITHLGGAGWRYTRAEVIRFINDGVHTFHTEGADGARAEVRVIQGPGGEYVRTHADGTFTDNLLTLAECALTVGTDADGAQ